MLLSLFAMVSDEVTEKAIKGCTKQILYADDLVLIGGTMHEFRENFDNGKKAKE